MASIPRLLVLSLAALFFFGGWQSTMAPEYAGSTVYSLVFAGLFWLGVALAVGELAHLARRYWKRVRSGSAGALR